MVAQKVKILIALLATTLVLIGAGVAYAANSGASDTSAGDRGGQVVGGDDDSDGPGDDADEPGDFDGPGDSEDRALKERGSSWGGQAAHPGLSSRPLFTEARCKGFFSNVSQRQAIPRIRNLGNASRSHSCYCFPSVT
jgi:hypothetical protein